MPMSDPPNPMRRTLTLGLGVAGPLSRALTRGLMMTVSLLWLVASASSASAQALYPSKTIRVLVPYGAGGSADNAARIVAERLALALGQPVVVDNRPGASGTLAANALAQAPGDGYTLMVAPTAVMAITPATRKTPYDPVRDFTPIARLSGALGMLTLSPAIPAKTLPEFLKLARENPGKYAFGSSGVGTITHLTGEVLQQVSGVKLLHVPYKTIVDGVGDFFAGRIALVFDPFILPQVRAGKAIAAASLGGRRHPEFADVPTIEELGIDLQGFSRRSWFGLFGPRDMPRDVVDRLNLEIERINRDPEVGRKLLALGLYPDYLPAAQFGPQLANDTAFFAALLKQLDLKLDN